MNGVGPISRKRALEVLALVVFSTSLIVSFAEFRKPPPARGGYTMVDDKAPAEGSKALSYVELRDSARGPSRDVYLASMEALRSRLPRLTEPFQRHPEDRERMLANRAKRRAFDGAPPIVPHPVDQRAIPNCMACHETGVVIGELHAPAMSHVAMSSCLQCHAPQSETLAPQVAAGTVTASNTFSPLPFGGLGARAWPGAPPSRPHTTAMRTNCGSCHGVAGDPGLRTSHPDRQNCEQCHSGAVGSDAIMAVISRGTD